MAENTIHEMISAYSTGCMDRENCEQFRNYIISGGDLPAGELGEFINIVSLIPTILDIEKPDKELKDRVAKELLKHKEEILKKIKNQNQNQKKPQSKKTPISENELPQTKIRSINEINPNEIENLSNEEMSKFNTLVRESDDEVIQAQQGHEPRRISSISNKNESNAVVSKLPWIILGIVVLILIIMFYFFSSINSTLEDEIGNLKAQVSQLETKMDDAELFISQNQTLVEFLMNNEIVVIDLNGTGENAGVYGKLFLSFDKQEGIVSFNNLPVIEQNQTYNLWMVSRGQSFSLGAFKPQMNGKYYTTERIPVIPIAKIDLFRLTVERAGDIQIPEGQTVLFGSVYTGINKQ